MKNDPAEQKIQAIEAEMSAPKAPVASKNEIMPGIRVIQYAELAKLDIPPPAWIVDKFIPDKSITIVSALPGQYKTWLTFDIAIKVAHGEALFGEFKTKQTKVLIIDEESGLGRLRGRLQMLGVTNNTAISVASYNNFKVTKESTESLITYCKANNIGLVIFDSLTRLHNADDNTAKEMSVVMANFKKLAQADVAVLLIHHNRKPALGSHDGANEMRGSVEILAACDAHISMKRSSNSKTVTVRQNKNRDAEEMPAFNLEFDGDEESGYQFTYTGNASRKADKAEDTDNAIRELLADGGMLFQQKIIETLKTNSVVGGEKMIASRLKVLAESGELIVNTGESGKHFYRLKLEQLSE